MIPQLMASAASGLVGQTDISFNITYPNLGRNGFLVVCATGKEEGGDTNPEEINVVSIDTWGSYPTFTRVRDANTGRTGTGMYVLLGKDLPAAGTHTIHVNFKDSPLQAERKCAVAAAFTNVKYQVAEATNAATDGDGGNSLSLTPLTSNALILASWGWRNGDAITSHWGTQIVDSSVNPGAALFYSIIGAPSAQTIAITSANPDENGIVGASFAMQASVKGQIL